MAEFQARNSAIIFALQKFYRTAIKDFNSAKIKRFCENNNIHDYDIIELKNIIDTTQQKIPFPDL